MAEQHSVWVGNQTALSACDLWAPFRYAVDSGFAAFEWFPDRNAVGQGWTPEEICASDRQEIRRVAQTLGVRLSVHAPCWLDRPALSEHLASLRFARDIGARVYNLHYDHTNGAGPFACNVRPLLRCAHELGLIVAVENTVFTLPDDFNQLIGCLRDGGMNGMMGVCLDIGHANLCHSTRNDFLGFIDALDRDVAIVHVHLHENWGDRDSHLPLFTGPSATDESGIRGFIARLRARGFVGAMILEQWPDPPSLLERATARFYELLSDVETRG